MPSKEEEARVVSLDPKQNSRTRSPVWHQPKGKKRASGVENRSAKKGHEERKKEKTGQGWSRSSRRDSEGEREKRQSERVSGGDYRRSGTQRVSETVWRYASARWRASRSPILASDRPWRARVASSPDARATRAQTGVPRPATLSPSGEVEAEAGGKVPKIRDAPRKKVEEVQQGTAGDSGNSGGACGPTA